jgi:hypothetical protein
MKTFKEFINEAAGVLSNRKPTLINQIHRAVEHLTRGIYSDDSWKPVHDIFATFDSLGLKWKTTGANYDSDPTAPSNSMPSSKRWKFEIEFINQKGKPDTIFGQIIASGAGSIANPLDKYDLVITLS